MVVVSPDNKLQSQPLLAQSMPAAPPQYSPAPGPSYQAVPIPNYWTGPPQVYVQPHRESAGRRFLKAFAVAVLVWFLLGALFQSIAELGVRRLSNKFGTTRPRPEDGSVVECLSQNSSLASFPLANAPSKYHTSYDFTLPFDADTGYYILSRGSMARGTLHLTDDHASDDVRVTVDVDYDSEDLFRASQICLLKHTDPNERGIGIYTPDRSESHFPLDRYLTYTVNFHIPSRFVKSFDSDLHNFAQHVNLADGAVTFESVSLRSSNGAILAQSLSGTGLSLRTSNALIKGRFLSNASVLLESSNGHIDAHVELTSSGAPANLTLRTSNDKITGAAVLKWAGPADARVQGAFDVSARTSNGDIDYAVDTPADSRLGLSARTSNSLARVRLGPSFEGDVLMRNSNAARPSVEVAGPVRDPTGRGRAYSWRVTSASSREWRGKVGWDLDKTERPEHWGNAEVVTSNGRCGLVVDDQRLFEEL